MCLYSSIIEATISSYTFFCSSFNRRKFWSKFTSNCWIFHIFSLAINLFLLIFIFKLFHEIILKIIVQAFYQSLAKSYPTKKSKILNYLSIGLLIPCFLCKWALRSSKMLFQNLFHKFNRFIRFLSNNKITNNALNWDLVHIFDASSKHCCHSSLSSRNLKATHILLNVGRKIL